MAGAYEVVPCFSHTARLFPDVLLWAVPPASCPLGQLVPSFKTNQDTPPLRSSSPVSTSSFSGSVAPLCTRLIAQVLCAAFQNERRGSSEVRQCILLLWPQAPGLVPADRCGLTGVRGRVWVHSGVGVVMNTDVSTVGIWPVGSGMAVPVICG